MSGLVNTVKTTIAENFGGASHKLAPEGTSFSLDEVPDQSGKVAVITGATEGIGYGALHTLLERNIKHVFSISISDEVIEGAKEDISSTIGPEAVEKVTWIICDTSDWPKIEQVAEQIKSKTDRIDILINNAARGIMTYQLTDYGVDRHMAVNHFGHAILTAHLTPLLKKTASEGNTVRIVNQGSNAHQGTPSDVKFASLSEMNQDLGPNGQYGRSKLATMLHARWLARHLTPSHPNLLANCTHPGFVETKMSKEDIHEPYPVAGYAMSIGMKPFKKDQWQGAISTLFAATKTTKSGEYICPPAIPEPGNELAQNEELGEQLMRLTTEVVKEKTRSQSVDKGCPFTYT